jgi:hypothetical protein
MELRGITASGIVYLFGEEFVSQGPSPLRRLALRLLFPESYGSSRKPPELERLVYSGQKVVRVDLATTIFQAAFVSLTHEGYISLRFLAKRDWNSVIVTEKKSGDDLPRSLERAVMNALRGDLDAHRVQPLVERVIGFVGPLSSPFQRVIHYVMERLSEEGYLGREVERRRFLPDKTRWSAHEEAIRPLAGEVETLKARLETFAMANAHLHGRLLHDVDAGIHGTHGLTPW